MIRSLIVSLLLSCGGDISIITVDKNQDTSIVSEPEVLNAPTSEPEQTSEPGAQDTGSKIGRASCRERV